MLGEAYEAALDDAQSLPAGEDRRARQREVSRELRDPALAYLRAGRGAAAESPAFVEGLIAFREERWDDALARLAEAQREVPSLYEARRLAGDVYTQMSQGHRDRGDVEGALALATQAAEAYRGAQEIARSDDSIHLGECVRRTVLVILEGNRGRSIDRHASEALAACDRALVVDPDSGAAHRQASAILADIAEAEAWQGKDPRPALDRAVSEADAAIALDPRDDQALSNRGGAWNVRGGFYEAKHGIDPRPSYAKAIESFERSIAIRPRAGTLTYLGQAHNFVGVWEANHGGDPLPHWQRAVENHERATALAPHWASPHINMGAVLGSRAAYEMSHGVDPRPSIAAAVAHHTKAIELNPSNPKPLSNLANAWARRALWERTHGVDCRASVDEAIRTYEKARAMKPDDGDTYDNLADTWRGPSPCSRWTAASTRPRRSRRRGRPSKPRSGSTRTTGPASWVGPAASFSPRVTPRATPRATPTRRPGSRPRSPTSPARSSSTRRTRTGARWRRRSTDGRPSGASRTTRRPETRCRRGLEAAARALQLDATMAEAHAVRGALLALQARGEKDPALRSKQEAEAKADLRKALEMNPLLKVDYPEP